MVLPDTSPGLPIGFDEGLGRVILPKHFHPLPTKELAMRIIPPFLLILLLLLPIPGLLAAETALGVDNNISAADSPLLDDLVAEALANNPDLQAGQERWAMNTETVAQAVALEDPTLSLGLNNYPIDSLAGDETPMTGQTLRLTQRFPFPGKLAARGEVAEQKALWYKAAYEDQKLQLTQNVKDVFYRIYYLDRAVAILQKNMALLDDFTRLAETRYEVGQGLQQDVLKAQVERSRLMDRIIGLRQQRLSAIARLNALLNRPTGAPLAPLADIAIGEVEIPVEKLQELSELQRPFYAAFRSLVDRFKAERELARLNDYPDFSLGAAYTHRQDNMGDDGTDFVGLEFSMSLPVYREKRRGAVGEAESGIRMALRQYEQFRNQIFFNIFNSYSEMAKNRELLRLYETGIIPQASQSYQAAVSAYQAGRVDFLTLIDALTKLYQDNLEYFRLVSTYKQNIARLEAESGVPVGEIVDALPADEEKN
jgi:outer membrane protein TolC